MPTPSTTNELYEYRISNIIKKMLHDLSPEGYFPENGEWLEIYLWNNKSEFTSYIMNDIQEYMGFDELLKQVKSSS